jgi:hypothetical protein
MARRPRPAPPTWPSAIPTARSRADAGAHPLGRWDGLATAAVIALVAGSVAALLVLSVP